MLLNRKTLIICRDAKAGAERDAGRRFRGQGQGSSSGGVIDLSGVMLRVYAAPNKQLDNLRHTPRHDTQTSMHTIALLISLAAVTVGLTYLLLPYFLRFIAQNIGSTIRARTQTRRELLLKRAADDEKSTPPTSNKDRLAKDNYNGKPAHEWDGIIGFFHPFWYQHLQCHGDKTLTLYPAMQVEAANESSGLPSAQPRNATPKLSA
jgi:hypothetical protein